MQKLWAFRGKSFPKQFGVYGNFKRLQVDEHYPFFLLVIASDFCHTGFNIFKSAQYTWIWVVLLVRNG